MNIDQIIFEAPVHRNMDQLARRFRVGKDKLTNALSSDGKLDLVTRVLRWSRLDLPDHRRKSRIKDVSGERFGKLVVMKRLPNKIGEGGRQHSHWLCKCDCGEEVSKSLAQIKKGIGTQCKNCTRIMKYGK